MIKNCEFAYKCPMNWDDLSFTDNASVRFCDQCQRNVYWVYTESDLAECIRLNRCVAILNHPESTADSPAGASVASSDALMTQEEELELFALFGVAKKALNSSIRDKFRNLILMGKVRGFLTHAELGNHMHNKVLGDEDLGKISALMHSMRIEVFPVMPASLGIPLAPIHPKANRRNASVNSSSKARSRDTKRK